MFLSSPAPGVQDKQLVFRQVSFLVKFLGQRGSEAADEFRHRLKKGQSIHARGYNFSDEARSINIL